MKLELKVKHFIECEYKPLLGILTPFSIVGYDCAIEKALKENFNTPRVWEYISHCAVQSIDYNHDNYDLSEFHEDQSIALKHKDDPEFVIRTLTLTPK